MDDTRRMGEPIKSVELKEDNVYIETARGDVWRVWLPGPMDHPLMELLHRSCLVTGQVPDPATKQKTVVPLLQRWLRPSGLSRRCSMVWGGMTSQAPSFSRCASQRSPTRRTLETGAQSCRLQQDVSG